jgi:hypothetical protein
VRLKVGCDYAQSAGFAGTPLVLRVLATLFRLLTAAAARTPCGLFRIHIADIPRAMLSARTLLFFLPGKSLFGHGTLLVTG